MYMYSYYYIRKCCILITIQTGNIAINMVAIRQKDMGACKMEIKRLQRSNAQGHFNAQKR